MLTTPDPSCVASTSARPIPQSHTDEGRQTGHVRQDLRRRPQPNTRVTTAKSSTPGRVVSGLLVPSVTISSAAGEPVSRSQVTAAALASMTGRKDRRAIRCDGSGVIVVGPAIWPSWSAPTSTDDRGAKKPGGRRCGPVPRAPLRRYARSRGRIELEWSGSPSHRGHAPWLPRTNEIAHARLACAKHWCARGGRDAVARGCERAPLACRRHARRRAGDGLKLCGADAASPPPPSPPASARTTRAREQR